jgi:hypothetical protein
MSRYLPKLARWMATVILLVGIVAGLSGFADFDAYGSAAADAAMLEYDAEIKVLRAAIQMCGGENSVATLVEDGLYQCTTKRGFKTAQVSP